MSIDRGRATVLTAAELDVALDLLDLGPAPAALELPGHGTTHAARARIVRETLDGFTTRGLFGAAGFAPSLVRDVRTLVAAEITLELCVAEPHLLRAVAGLRGGEAVLAVRTAGHIALLRISPDRAAESLVGLLGPVVPGPGPTVRIPFAVLLDALDACGGDRSRLPAELLRLGCSGAETELVVRMGELHALAEFGAVRGGPVPCRAPSFVLVLVTPHGHYVQRRPAPDRLGGRPAAGAVVVAGPADAATLVAELDGLAEGARTRRPPVPVPFHRPSPHAVP